MDLASTDLIESVEHSIATRTSKTILLLILVFVVGEVPYFTVDYPIWLPQKPSGWLFLYGFSFAAALAQQQSVRNEKKLLAPLKELEGRENPGFI